MTKFKIGDNVYVTTHKERPPFGSVGIVLAIGNIGVFRDYVLVKFPNWGLGHSGNGPATFEDLEPKSNRDKWWLHISFIDLVKKRILEDD